MNHYLKQTAQGGNNQNSNVNFNVNVVIDDKQLQQIYSSHKPLQQDK